MLFCYNISNWGTKFHILRDVIPFTTCANSNNCLYQKKLILASHAHPLRHFLISDVLNLAQPGNTRSILLFLYC